MVHPPPPPDFLIQTRKSMHTHIPSGCLFFQILKIHQQYAPFALINTEKISFPNNVFKATKINISHFRSIMTHKFSVPKYASIFLLLLIA